MKQIIVVCGAYPDQGKGVVTGAISYVLKQSGHSSLPFKYDGYLNVSSGDMNPLNKEDKLPYQGEEVFVLEDGLETDADSGTYERFVGEKLGSWHVASGGGLTMSTILDSNISSGKIQNHIDVIKACEKWIDLAIDRVDIPIIEVGGTVNDPEQDLLFRALKRVSTRRGVAYKLVLLSPYMKTANDTDPSSILSFRTKITRMALEHLEEMGLMADIVACNSPDGSFKGVDTEYITASYGYLKNRVLNLGWRENPYEKTRDALDILKRINPELVKSFVEGRLEKYVDSAKNAKSRLSIDILGDTVSNDTYKSIVEGIEHASYFLGIKPEVKWLSAKPAKRNGVYVVTDSRGYEMLSGVNVVSLLAVGEAFTAYAESLGNVENADSTYSELLGAAEISFGLQSLWVGSNGRGYETTRFRHIRGIKNINIRQGTPPPGSIIDFARAKDGRIVGIKQFGRTFVHTAIASHPEFDSIPGTPSGILLKHIEETYALMSMSKVGGKYERSYE